MRSKSKKLQTAAQIPERLEFASLSFVKNLSLQSRIPEPQVEYACNISDWFLRHWNESHGSNLENLTKKKLVSTGASLLDLMAYLKAWTSNYIVYFPHAIWHWRPSSIAVLWLRELKRLRWESERECKSSSFSSGSGSENPKRHTWIVRTASDGNMGVDAWWVAERQSATARLSGSGCFLCCCRCRCAIAKRAIPGAIPEPSLRMWWGDPATEAAAAPAAKDGDDVPTPPPSLPLIEPSLSLGSSCDTERISCPFTNPNPTRPQIDTHPSSLSLSLPASFSSSVYSLPLHPHPLEPHNYFFPSHLLLLLLPENSLLWSYPEDYISL